MVNTLNVESTGERGINLLAFDLDGTLASSKSPIASEMGERLSSLLENYDLCIITGATFAQIDKQVIGQLPESANLGRLHIMPVCGTQYFRCKSGEWRLDYVENLTDQERDAIKNAIDGATHDLRLVEPVTYGETIEDRGSQITFSALGQDIVNVMGEKGIRLKEAWDPDGSKKAALVERLSAKLPEYSVRAGGTTSVDITRKGIDKAYGIGRLIDILGLSKEDVLFFGDKLEPGGNDHPVKAMGIETVAVDGWEDTYARLTGLFNS